MNEIEEYLEEGTFSIIIDNIKYTIPKYCPHRHGWLAHGNVNIIRKTVTCPLHFSTFSLETGKQLSGPDCGANLKVTLEAL
nr:Rieske 2Fe-2S domain-containing protein [Pseudomonas luteola]